MRVRDVEVRDVELIRHGPRHAKLVTPPRQHLAIRSDDPHAASRPARLPGEQMKHPRAGDVGLRRERSRDVIGARLQLRFDAGDFVAHPRHLAVDVRQRPLVEIAVDARGRDERDQVDRRDSDQKESRSLQDAMSCDRQRGDCEKENAG